MTRSQLFAFSAMFCTATIPTFGAPQKDGKPDIRPAWSSRAELTDAANCSFLSDYEHTDENNPMPLLFKNRQALELRQQLDDVNRDYEMKQNYGLINNYQEQQHGGDLTNFGRSALSTVRQNQLSQSRETLKSASEKNEGLRTVAKPAIIVGTGAAIYTGTPVNVRVDDETRMSARTNVPRQQGQFELFSPMVNGSVEVNMNVGNAMDPAAPRQDPTVQDERYRMSLSRGLPIWDLSSGVTYGTTTSTMTASLSKKLSNSLTAVVDSSHPMDTAKAPLAPSGGETLKFLYGIRF